MKKILVSVLLIAMVLTGAFAQGEKESATTVLKVAGLKGAYGDTYWKNLETAFEASHPGVDVQLTIESNVEDTITPQIMAGAGPDVVYLATQRAARLTETMIDSKALMDLTSLLDATIPGENVKLGDKILSSVMGNGVTNPYADQPDNHYMLPFFFASNGLYFDADRFYSNNGNGVEDAKVDGKYEMPTTWDEFFTLGDMLNAERKADPSTPWLFTYPTAGYLDTLIPASIVASAGKEVGAEAFSYGPVWNLPEVRIVFENLGRIKDYILPTTVGNANGEGFRNNQQALIDGDALFLTNGSWVIGEMADTTPADFVWGVTPFFAFENGGDRYGTVNVEQIWINAATPNADLAKEFVLFCYSDEGLKIIADGANGAFVPAKGFEKFAAESDAYSDGTISGYQGYYDGSADVLVGSFLKASAEGVDWKATYCNTMDSVMNGSKTVDQWIDQLSKDAAKLRANM